MESNIAVEEIDIFYLPGGRSLWEKPALPEVLNASRGRQPRAVFNTKGRVFAIRTDLDR